MAVFSYEWCRVEGCLIPDLRKEYGTFTNMPSNIRIFYGTPEIQINNPISIVNGCVYKVVPISEFGYDTILKIDENYNTVSDKIENYDRTIDIQDKENSALYYYKPFVVEESCIILYADSTKKEFDHYAVLYVDKYATPEIIDIKANYIGNSIPVGETFSLNDIELFAIYSDGNRAQIKENFTVEPEDRIITELKSNLIKITYVSPTNTTFITNVVIEGIRNLCGIEAYYDGPQVPYGKEALKKYFVVIAKYTDDTSVAVNEFTFPEGNIVSETNYGVITVYYKGFYTTVSIPTLEVSSSRLVAYYNGPNIEINNNFDIKYCTIRIYYQTENNINAYYENVNPESCNFSTFTIDHEGINHILVQFIGKSGPVTTTMIVVGIKPEVVLNFIEANYVGPEITQGKPFRIDRIICKAHYSDGTIVEVKNFTINSNIIQYEGLNEYVATYTDKDTTVTTTFTVKGLKPDDTTETGYNPIYLQNNYPELTRLNNRYRGPAESYKHDSMNTMLFENIARLYELFYNIENDFNNTINTIEGKNSIKIKALNTMSYLNHQTNNWIQDDRFTTGKYQLKEEQYE